MKPFADATAPLSESDREEQSAARDGRMPASPARWYVVRAKTGQDPLALRGLSRSGLETFQPFARIPVPGRGARTSRTEPLFRGYVFAHFAPDHCLELVRYLPGVAYVVSSGRCPVAVDDSILAELRARLASDGFIHLRRQRYLPNQPVTIVQGPFTGWLGRVEQEWDDGRRVAILLEALHDARVLLAPEALEPVA
jgi:transcription antitermination factor NusG